MPKNPYGKQVQAPLAGSDAGQNRRKAFGAPQVSGNIVKDAAGTTPNPIGNPDDQYHASVVKNLKDLHHNGKK